MCLLHCASAAGALSAAESYCGIPGNSSVDECGDGGLVCVPKTSGSAAVICVCRGIHKIAVNVYIQSTIHFVTSLLHLC